MTAVKSPTIEITTKSSKSVNPEFRLNRALEFIFEVYHAPLTELLLTVSWHTKAPVERSFCVAKSVR